MSRTTWIGISLAALVAVSGTTWAVAAQVMRSPAELAAEAEPPEPSEVTVPVERTELVADVIVRSTVRFDEPFPVSLGGNLDVDGELIVTRIPEEGAEVDEGDVLLEVSGRPVFVLSGQIPMFRDLRPGSSGEDIEGLQAALDRLGYDVGSVDGVLGDTTQAAIDALYEDAGFAPPAPSTEEVERIEQAEERRANAEDQLAQAQAQLEQARAGPSRADRLQADARVNEARDALEALPDEASDADVRRAEEALEIARAARDELLAEPDTSAEERAVAAAAQERDEAQAQLDRLNAQTGTWFPAGEVVVVEELPQRIDAVAVGRGEPATGELLTISSSEIVLLTEIPAEDVDLVEVGDPVYLRPDGGEERPGQVVELADRPGTDHAGEDGYAARVEPEGDADELVGTSVRVRIPVSGTDGEVLAVPLVAVFAAADGTSQVEVVDDGADPDDPNARRTVTVEPGLTADGLVEVTPIDGDLAEGDQVVVGS